MRLVCVVGLCGCYAVQTGENTGRDQGWPVEMVSDDLVSGGLTAVALWGDQLHGEQ